MESEPKILIVNSYDHGGAAKACIRLHIGLLRLQSKSKLLLKTKKDGSIPESFQFQQEPEKNSFRRHLNNFYNAFSLNSKSVANSKMQHSRFKMTLPKGSDTFSFPVSNLDITKSRLYEEADIVNLHWVSDFLDYPSFFRKNKKPVVWTMHDIEPFSGGQHYFENYLGMDENCRPERNHLPKTVLQTIEANLSKKKEALENIKDLHVVCPSKWLTYESMKSTLFKNFPHYTIPYGVDTTIFKPLLKDYSRELLGLPKDKICILFVADSITKYRKGFAFLNKALEQLNDNNEILLCAIGHAMSDYTSTSKIRYLGRINDDRIMAAAYSASDVFVIPSIEDNLPNTVLESLLCGTPVIGFPVGGIPDMVDDGKNGLLCTEVSAAGLSTTIMAFLKTRDSFNMKSISEQAAKKYNLSVQAESYRRLYSDLTRNKYHI